VARDKEDLTLGKVKIRVLHTPGHTMESATFLLFDEQGKEYAIFSGDTLFIGDVGRPDLAQQGEITTEILAGYLYDSLRTKVMPLPDAVIVYPGHGAGSACGKNMSSETEDTLGHQKKTNYALRADMSRSEFVAAVTDGLMSPPGYFPQNARLNREGYDSIDTVMARGCQALDVAAFEAAASESGALLLDTRDPQVFAQGFIPGSVNIGVNGNFAPWVGALIPDIRQQILVIAEEGRVQEVVTRLARVGYDFAIGYLSGGFEAWKQAGRETDQIESVSAADLARLYAEHPTLRILDVRKASEFGAEHIIGAENLPLDVINQHMAQVGHSPATYVHCAGGYRSMIFTSILRARGYNNLINIEGGFAALKETGLFALSAYVAPKTML
jgi:rhodanese-related sulfurtransferase